MTPPQSLYYEGNMPYWGNNVTRDISMCFPSNPFELSKDTTILDWGCSTGKSTYALKGMYPHSRVIGVEKDESVRFGDYPDIELYHMDGYAMTFAKGFFDAVFCMNNISLVADLVDTETLESLLPRITRAVADSGYLLVGEDMSYVAFRQRGPEFIIDSHHFEKEEDRASNTYISKVSSVLTGKPFFTEAYALARQDEKAWLEAVVRDQIG